MVITDQLFPFQWSIRLLIKLLPTTKQLVVLGHDTPNRAASIGLGIVVIFQLDPFQCSTTPRPKSLTPTAKQFVGLGHDTPTSSGEVEPLGLGLGTTDHAGVAPAGGATATKTPAIRQTAAANVTNAGRRNRREWTDRLA
jgi:hypothetical protein